MTENTANARTFSKSFDENISMAYWGGGEGCGRPGGKMGGKVNILNLKNWFYALKTILSYWVK